MPSTAAAYPERQPSPSATTQSMPQRQHKTARRLRWARASMHASWRAAPRSETASSAAPVARTDASHCLSRRERSRRRSSNRQPSSATTNCAERDKGQDPGRARDRRRGSLLARGGRRLAHRVLFGRCTAIVRSADARAPFAHAVGRSRRKGRLRQTKRHRSSAAGTVRSFGTCGSTPRRRRSRPGPSRVPRDRSRTDGPTR